MQESFLLVWLNTFDFPHTAGTTQGWQHGPLRSQGLSDPLPQGKSRKLFLVGVSHSGARPFSLLALFPGR